MPRLSFSLRDMFWLTLVVGMALGWWAEHRVRTIRFHELIVRWDADMHRMRTNLGELGYVTSEGERPGMLTIEPAPE